MAERKAPRSIRCSLSVSQKVFIMPSNMKIIHTHMRTRDGSRIESSPASARRALPTRGGPNPPPPTPSPRYSLDVLSLRWEKAKPKSCIYFRCFSPRVCGCTPVGTALRVKGTERGGGGRKKKGPLNKSCLFLLRGKKRTRCHKHPQGWLDSAAGGLDSVMPNHGRL